DHGGALRIVRERHACGDVEPSALPGDLEESAAFPIRVLEPEPFGSAGIVGENLTARDDRAGVRSAGSAKLREKAPQLRSRSRRNEPKQGRALGEKPRVGERLLRGALEPVLGGDRCELDARTSILQGETVKDRVRREREPPGDEERQ